MPGPARSGRNVCLLVWAPPLLRPWPDLAVVCALFRAETAVVRTVARWGRAVGEAYSLHAGGPCPDPRVNDHRGGGGDVRHPEAVEGPDVQSSLRAWRSAVPRRLSEQTGALGALMPARGPFVDLASLTGDTASIDEPVGNLLTATATGSPPSGLRRGAPTVPRTGCGPCRRRPGTPGRPTTTGCRSRRGRRRCRVRGLAISSRGVCVWTTVLRETTATVFCTTFERETLQGRKSWPTEREADSAPSDGSIGTAPGADTPAAGNDHRSPSGPPSSPPRLR